MLDRVKLLAELSKVQQYLSSDAGESIQSFDQWCQMFLRQQDLAQKIGSRKWSLLVPSWQGNPGQSVPIAVGQHPYTVLAVDGSQIYYDKHQGPGCYLINTGSVVLQYGIQVSQVHFDSQPEVVVPTGHNQMQTGVEFVSAYREQKELECAVEQSLQHRLQDQPFVCMLDGSMIFFQVDPQMQDSKINFFAQYLQSLESLYQHKILHVAYMSFPKTKDLLNVVRLMAADFQEALLEETSDWYKFSDMDVVRQFLQQGHRTILFESKAPITYAYPKHLKPYFCYVHVGYEIIRLEFPQWIAQDAALVDQICGLVLNQVEKGYGYPVALFEAHEQAVVKSVDREFFYQLIKNMHVEHNAQYYSSLKSLKKQQVPV